MESVRGGAVADPETDPPLLPVVDRLVEEQRSVVLGPTHDAVEWGVRIRRDVEELDRLQSFVQESNPGRKVRHHVAANVVLRGAWRVANHRLAQIRTATEGAARARHATVRSDEHDVR